MYKNRKKPELTYELIDSLFYSDPIEGKIYSKVKRGISKWTLNVGDECGCMSMVGSRRKTVYWTVGFTVGKIKYIERRSKLMFILHHKRLPQSGWDIDHINGNTLDDSLNNLQEIPRSLNRIKGVNNPRNVVYNKQYGNYRVKFSRNKQHLYFKIWDTLEEATADAQRWRDEYNKTNFPEFVCDIPQDIPEIG